MNMCIVSDKWHKPGHLDKNSNSEGRSTDPPGVQPVAQQTQGFTQVLKSDKLHWEPNFEH